MHGLKIGVVDAADCVQNDENEFSAEDVVHVFWQLMQSEVWELQRNTRHKLPLQGISEIVPPARFLIISDTDFVSKQDIVRFTTRFESL
mmetsp:Transcript_29669/g.40760  ORF Transcript_29669/g.40760 Transcript_29669/m.40760 type:complete len:89 (-) Transcript_29669:1545-1811(-)